MRNPQRMIPVKYENNRCKPVLIEAFERKVYELTKQTNR